MSGEELKKKLDGLGISQAKLAELMGVFPQSFNKTLQADDVKSGFIEKLCRVLNKDISFFYGGESSQKSDKLEKANSQIKHLLEAVEQLQEDNSRLKSEIIHLKNPEREKTESEIYRLWMEHMKITERMQELYKSQKDV